MRSWYCAVFERVGTAGHERKDALRNVFAVFLGGAGVVSPDAGKGKERPLLAAAEGVPMIRRRLLPQRLAV